MWTSLWPQRSSVRDLWHPQHAITPWYAAKVSIGQQGVTRRSAGESECARFACWRHVQRCSVSDMLTNAESLQVSCSSAVGFLHPFASKQAKRGRGVFFKKKKNIWLSLDLDLLVWIKWRKSLNCCFRNKSDSCNNSQRASASFSTGYFDILLCCRIVVWQRKRPGLRHALWAHYWSSWTLLDVLWQQPPELPTIIRPQTTPRCFIWSHWDCF